MNRRAFFFAGLVVPLVPGLAMADQTNVQVMYVGGQDCPYCALWRERYEANWKASPEFKAVAWVEIEPPSLRQSYQARFWPGSLKDVLDQVPRKNGTPRFLIVKDGKVVFNDIGVDRWNRAMLALKNVLG
jgi:hypothetical protein